MGIRLALLSLCLPTLVVLSGCVPIHTGSYTTKRTISTRLDHNGKAVESLEEEEVISKTFWPATPDGPFVSRQHPSKLVYFLVRTNGTHEKLPFLTKKKSDAYHDFAGIFPISQDRWLGISRTEAAPYVEEASALNVTVFDQHGILWSKTITGCYYNTLQNSPHWKPLRDDMKVFELNYKFDRATEEVTFRTYEGDFLFKASDGSLQKIGTQS